MKIRMQWLWMGCVVVGLSGLAFGAGAGAGKAFNPDISISLLGTYSHDIAGSSNRFSGVQNGFSLQESEMQFLADIDPYFRANALFSMTQKATNGPTLEFGLDPEEVYFETISLPVVTLRVGKLKAALGKHNQLHTHAFPFIDQPLINSDLLGSEGLNEIGLSAAALIPAPWFLELTAQILSNNNPTLYNSSSASDPSGVLQIKNLWDLSDSLTLEWSLYGTAGANSYGYFSEAAGSDLIFKWRPVEGGKYSALIWQTEYLLGNVTGNPGGAALGGLATWLQWQFAERWWVEARGEFEGIPSTGSGLSKTKQSVLLAFLPSEFSGFRVQFDHLAVAGAPVDYAMTLQYNITMGAHPAHSY